MVSVAKAVAVADEAAALHWAISYDQCFPSSLAAPPTARFGTKGARRWGCVQVGTGVRHDLLFWVSQSLTWSVVSLPLLAVLAHVFFWLSHARLAADWKSVCRPLARGTAFKATKSRREDTGDRDWRW